MTQALAATYQALRRDKVPDWHLLRLYVANELPGALVTPPRTSGRGRAPVPSVADRFLDPAGQVKVCGRADFVGRRRVLQAGLRALRSDSDKLGVAILGPGGLGKSSVAARLCDRATKFQRVIYFGYLDEAALVRGLATSLEILDKRPEWREWLQDPEQELRFRLRRLLRELREAGEPPLLWVLDDFEQNLDAATGQLRGETPAVLAALIWALQQVGGKDRLLITCRYDIAASWMQYIDPQRLDGLREADLAKKCRRLAAFGVASPVEANLRERGLRLADGNPRLLEWLDKLLQDETLDRQALLAKLEALETDQADLREQVLAQAVIAQIDEPLRQFLGRGLIFELPVPRAVLAAVCGAGNAAESQIDRATALGLLEVSPEGSRRVPRVLPVQLPAAGEALAGQAAAALYRCWWQESKTSTEAQRLEMHRLALAGQQGEMAAEIGSRLASRWKNQSRFRDAMKLCQDTLATSEDYRILHQLARAEQDLGEVSQAAQHYQRALDTCSTEDETEKAAIIHNLAGIYAQQGEVEQAIALYQQSLELQERIGNVQGKAATLHQMAGIY
ncbi:MAG: tetratricopeptide repeat protein, partial [Spirulinaceae cyanobacterium SM2_1_0]|nr:tetratricopeptide repeat protein [Spirulinaceae cyanobacterium SM2_1_0]